MRSTLSFVLLFFTINACTVDRNSLRGWDYRLFKGTPAWGLAKAVRDSDLQKVRELVASGVDVDLTEGRFGQTLLQVAVRNHNYEACKALLELGADPNKHNSYWGASAMILSAGIVTGTNLDTAMLSLMIKFGGNPNDEEVGKEVTRSARLTPLLAACEDIGDRLTVHKVRILVDHGADINHRNEFVPTPLSTAIIFDHMDVALFLLQRGADYTQVMLVDIKGEPKYLLEMLRRSRFPIGSQKHKDKMAIVEFLKERGVDYFKAPVPSWVLDDIKKEYPNGWREYVEKY